MQRKRSTKRRLLAELDLWEKLELMCGPNGNPLTWAFANDAERKEAWQIYKHDPFFQDPGRRAWAFWEFDAEPKRTVEVWLTAAGTTFMEEHDEHDLEALDAQGLMTPADLVELRRLAAEPDPGTIYKFDCAYDYSKRTIAELNRLRALLARIDA